jgi:hypothetical protein
MPMNRIQFQPGLSMREFQRQYASDEQCEAALFASRWPSGWACPQERRQCAGTQAPTGGELQSRLAAQAQTAANPC